MIKFHTVYEKLSQALDGFPSDALEVSDEIKEQVLSFNFSYLRALGLRFSTCCILQV